MPNDKRDERHKRGMHAESVHAKEESKTSLVKQDDDEIAKT